MGGGRGLNTRYRFGNADDGWCAWSKCQLYIPIPFAIVVIVHEH